MSESKKPDVENLETIDHSIITCGQNIASHKFHSYFILVLLIATTIGLYESFKYQEELSSQLLNVNTVVNMNDPKTTNETEIEHINKLNVNSYVIFAVFVFVFGVLLSLYRYQLNEISRNEQMKLGFIRIKIAAMNTSSGFQTEVRQTLTRDAFVFNPKITKEKKEEVESPIPGHPTSEIVTTLLNKILDSIEFNVKQKK